MLTVKGKVEVVAGFEPQRLNLGQVKMGTSVTQEARLMGSKLDKMHPGEPVSSHPDQLKVEKDASDPLKYRVTFTAPEKAGSFSGQIKVKTGLETPEEIVLYVFGQVAADIVADRQFAYFGWIPEPGAGGVALSPLEVARRMFSSGDAVMRLHLRSLSGQPFRITGVEDAEGTVVGVASPAEGGWNVFLVAVKRPERPNGVVHINTDRSDQPVLEMRYMVRPQVGGKRPAPSTIPIPMTEGGRPMLKAAPLLRKTPERMNIKKMEPAPLEGGK